MIKIQITSEEAGMRVDRLLRKRLSLMKLSDIYSLIRKGGVKVDEKKTKQDYRLVEGQTIDVYVDSSELTAPKATDSAALSQLRNTDFFKRNFKVIYEDDDLLACDKPQGLVVHPGTGHLRHDTLIDLAMSYLLDKSKGKATEEPALVHRIDRDTSGVILIAKNKRILRGVHDLFRGREIVKEYRAICHKRPPEFEGTVKIGMSRNFESDSGTKMRVDEDGSDSQSRYKIIEYHDDLSYLEVYLDTGKTHQIRVHMAHIGCPIVGDERYGNPELDKTMLSRSGIPNRLYLHAHRLVFPHPATGRKLTLIAPIPSEFRKIMEDSSKLPLKK